MAASVASAALIFSVSAFKALVNPSTNVAALAWVSAALETVGRELVQHIVASHHALFREEEALQPKTTRDDRLTLVEVQRALREHMQELVAACPGLRSLVDAFLDSRAAGLLHIDAPAAAAVAEVDGGAADGDDASPANIDAVKAQWSKRKTEAVTDVDVAHLLLASQPAFAFNTDALIFVQVRGAAALRTCSSAAPLQQRCALAQLPTPSLRPPLPPLRPCSCTSSSSSSGRPLLVEAVAADAVAARTRRASSASRQHRPRPPSQAALLLQSSCGGASQRATWLQPSLSPPSCRQSAWASTSTSCAGRRRVVGGEGARPTCACFRQCNMTPLLHAPRAGVAERPRTGAALGRAPGAHRRGLCRAL